MIQAHVITTCEYNYYTTIICSLHFTMEFTRDHTYVISTFEYYYYTPIICSLDFTMEFNGITLCQ